MSKNLTTDGQRDQIRQAMRSRKNILVIGTIGSGKVQLTSQIAAETAAMFPMERVAFLCDLPEYVVTGLENLVCCPSSKGINAAIQDLNQWVFVEDLRDPRLAFDLVNAWKRGYCGGAMIHGASVAQGLTRLKALVEGAGGVAADVDEFVDMIVLMEPTTEGPRVKDIQSTRRNFVLDADTESSVFNPLAAAREFLVETLEQAAGIKLDAEKRVFLLAIVADLPENATMYDLYEAINLKEAESVGLTSEQYKALTPLLEALKRITQQGA